MTTSKLFGPQTSMSSSLNIYIFYRSLVKSTKERSCDRKARSLESATTPLMVLPNRVHVFDAVGMGLSKVLVAIQVPICCAANVQCLKSAVPAMCKRYSGMGLR